MTRATKIKRARRETASPARTPRLPRGLLFVAAAGVAGLIAAVVVLWNSGSNEAGETVFTGVAVTDPGPIHVHGLGINPADGALFIATHTGLFRVGASSRKAVRISDRNQDTMGFSVVGPDRFIGSGHPDQREQSLPPLLGLIESTDAGESWKPISLLGEADFHVLRSSGKHVYGYDASNDRLLASTDAGRGWRELDRPAPIVDLAPNPSDPRRLVTTAVGALDQGLFASDDGGDSWNRLGATVGLIAWPVAERLYVVADQGSVLVSSDGGRTLTTRGTIGGQPAALLAVGKDELYVALHDGTIKRSADGGAVWTIRARP